MKSMKAKLIALMMVIPMLLIFTTSSVVKITSILVAVPVSKIEILGEKIRRVNITDPDNTVQLETLVYPENATNKKVTYSADAVGGKEEAAVSISDSGRVSPLSVGFVVITAYCESRFATMQIEFYSDEVAGVKQISSELALAEGDLYTVAKDVDFIVFCENPAYDMKWRSGDKSIAEVDEFTGEITAKLAGSTTVTGEVDGIAIDRASGKIVEKKYTIIFAVNVGAAETLTGLSFGGKDTETKPTLSSVIFNFSYNAAKMASYGTPCLVFDESIFESAELSYQSGKGKITAKFKESAPNEEKYEIKILAENKTEITSVFVVKSIISTAEISSSFNALKLGKNVRQYSFGIKTDFEAADSSDEVPFTVEYFSDDTSVLDIHSVDPGQGKDKLWYAIPKAEGTANISAKIYTRDSHKQINIGNVSKEILVCVSFVSLSFKQSTDSFGLENEFAFGGYELNGGTLEKTTYTLSLVGALSNVSTLSEIPNTNSDKLTWVSDDESVATVDNGVVSLTDKSGVVTISAESAYNSALKENVRASFKINCISDGINVDNYDELMYCSKNAKKSVLQDSVRLAPRLEQQAYSDYKNYLLNECTFAMKTSADDSYYVNNGKASDAYVRYCLEFTDDVYGNGHSLNADNITMKAQKNFGYSVFNGPLDIVRLKYENTSTQNASVKAQDNIVFLARKDGLKIHNVELKGCDDESVAGDLSNLDNCGTVLEVMGSCEVEYCKINNGRTVVRAFGRPMASESEISSNPSAYRISVVIGNCDLSYGREFILKLGSNQAKKNPSVTGQPYLSGSSYTPASSKALYDDASPYFSTATGESYPVQGQKDQYFYDNYVMTDVTLRDSVFTTAGLFCIGLESKFGGLCLHGYDFNDTYRFGSTLGWKNIAGTSYPALLRLEGDVRFYDWKKVDEVNSETLIEGDPQILDVVGLNLNVKNLIGSYSGVNADKLTVTYGENKYVNGAIAFYGGGKNYSAVDTAGVSVDFNRLSDFSIPLSVLGSRVNLIYYSAGAENFRFMLYDSNCALDIAKQQNDIADSTAYKWIYKK